MEVNHVIYRILHRRRSILTMFRRSFARMAVLEDRKADEMSLSGALLYENRLSKIEST